MFLASLLLAITIKSYSSKFLLVEVEKEDNKAEITDQCYFQYGFGSLMVPCCLKIISREEHDRLVEENAKRPLLGGAWGKHHVCPGNAKKAHQILTGEEVNSTLEQQQKKQALDLFQSLDSDTNGKLTLKELNASKHRIDDIKEAFDRMDQDKNGVITVAEIDDDMEEFLESQNNTKTEGSMKEDKTNVGLPSIPVSREDFPDSTPCEERLAAATTCGADHQCMSQRCAPFNPGKKCALCRGSGGQACGTECNDDDNCCSNDCTCGNDGAAGAKTKCC